MKPNQQPIKANKLKSTGSNVVSVRSHQTMVFVPNPAASFQTVDWKQIARVAGRKLRSVANSGFNTIKSATFPLWQQAKQWVVNLVRTYYNRAVCKYEDWNQQFFNEMDSFTLLDEPVLVDKLESQATEVNGNRSANSTGFLDQFSGNGNYPKAVTFSDFKRQVFRYLEKAIVKIETAIGKWQGVTYQAVIFEVVNADQLALIPVSNKRKSRLEEASVLVDYEPVSLNLSKLQQRFTETRQYFANKLGDQLRDFATIGYQIVRKMLPSRMNPAGDAARNMLLPLLNKSGFGILANNRGYP
jgi:hypothetical protein